MWQVSGEFCAATARKQSVCNQRTPWGGGKRRGVENLTNDTPPKKGFWTPPRTVRFPPPSGVSALFFLYKNPRQSRPKALLEGSKNFRESAFSGTFSSPHTFCTPPYHGGGNSQVGPKSGNSSGGGSEGVSLNSRAVLQTEVAIASEVSNSSKNSQAITDCLAKKTQLVNHCKTPLSSNPHSRFPTEI